MTLSTQLEALAERATAPDSEKHWVGYETREQMRLHQALVENLPTIIAALKESGK